MSSTSQRSLRATERAQPLDGGRDSAFFRDRGEGDEQRALALGARQRRVLWLRFGDGAPLGPRRFADAAQALGDAMAARQFEVDMMAESHLKSAAEIAQAQRKAGRRGRR